MKLDWFSRLDVGLLLEEIVEADLNQLNKLVERRSGK